MAVIPKKFRQFTVKKLHMWVKFDSLVRRECKRKGLYLRLHCSTQALKGPGLRV